MRLVLADDHPLFRDGIRSLLEARGLQVVGEASGASETVRLALSLRPDLVLMDIGMPDGGGLEATRLIKASAPDIKIIILTVYDDDQTLFEAIRCGADGYLTKNLKSDQFFSLLEGVARGEPAISPRLASRILQELGRHIRGEAKPPTPEELTEREREVLQLVAAGATNREIAERLFITENTVKFHIRNILDKLHLRNRAEAVAYAMRRGLLAPPG